MYKLLLVAALILPAFAQTPAQPTLTPDSLQHTGVPTGTLTGPLTLTSKIYDGMVSQYWIYVPAQYDPKSPAALMVFQDGGGYIHRDGDHPALNVLDNLIAQHKIPVMIAVFTDPGTSPARPTPLPSTPSTPTLKNGPAP